MTLNIAELKESQFDFVHDSQRTFRALMMALSFPGKIFQLPSLELTAPRKESGFILQPFLSLLDLETSFHVSCDDPVIRNHIVSYLELNTNCLSRRHQEADFILSLGSLAGRYPQLKRGTLSNPNDSATVIYGVNQITETPVQGSVLLTLRGPGIKTKTDVAVSGLADAEIEMWNNHKSDYPMGIDIYLISSTGDIIGIPRSVKIQLTGGV